MGTFYRGCKLLSNKVVANYNEGKYFNESTKLMEKITDPINKYNQQFLIELKDISADFYTLITTEKIAIKLMSMNSNANQGDICNLWNLIRSQGGTIRYNRVLRKALKTYGITKKKLFDELTIELNKEKDRVLRNRQLVLQLLRDYGLGKMLDIIEAEHGMNMCEHIQEYLLSKDLNIGIGLNKEDTDELKKYYEKLEDTYIDYLRELANKNGINFDNAISESLLNHRSIVEEKHQQILREKAQKKEDDKRGTALASMDKDNSGLFHDINAGCYDKMLRINSSIANDMRNRIGRLGGKAYYIAVSKYQTVYYIREDGKLTKDIRKANLFKTTEEAEIFYNTVKDTNYEIKISYYRVYALDAPDKTTDIVIDSSGKTMTLTDKNMIYENNKKMSEIGNTLGKLLSAKDNLTLSDQKLIREILIRIHGYNCNRSDGQFIIFKASNDNGKVQLIGREGNSFKFVSSYLKAVKAVPGEDLQIYVNEIKKFLDEKSPKSGLVIEKISFNSKWYAEMLDRINNKHINVLKKLNNLENCLGELEYKDVQNFAEKLIYLKQQGAERVWLVTELKESDTAIKYAATRTTGNGVETYKSVLFKSANIYTNYEEACIALQEYFDPSGLIVSKLLEIQL